LKGSARKGEGSIFQNWKVKEEKLWKTIPRTNIRAPSQGKG